MSKVSTFSPAVNGGVRIDATTTGATFNFPGIESMYAPDVLVSNLGTAGAGIALPGSTAVLPSSGGTTGLTVIAPNAEIMLSRGAATSGTAMSISGVQTLYLTVGNGRAV